MCAWCMTTRKLWGVSWSISFRMAQRVQSVSRRPPSQYIKKPFLSLKLSNSLNPYSHYQFQYPKTSITIAQCLLLAIWTSSTMSTTTTCLHLLLDWLSPGPRSTRRMSLSWTKNLSLSMSPLPMRLVSFMYDSIENYSTKSTPKELPWVRLSELALLVALPPQFPSSL